MLFNEENYYIEPSINDNAFRREKQLFKKRINRGETVFSNKKKVILKSLSTRIEITKVKKSLMNPSNYFWKANNQSVEYI